MLVQDYPAVGLDASKVFYQRDAAAFAQAAKEQGLPAAICSTMPENMDEQTRQLLISKAVAPMQGIHEALNAIHAAANWLEVRHRILLEEPEPLSPTGEWREQAMVTEDKSKLWLVTNGFSVPEGRVASEKDACSVASEVGYPVALKMISPLLAHKTEAGAVVLNLKDSDTLVIATKQMKVDVTAYNPKAVTDKFLVEAMSPAPLAELVVTLRRDRQFGAALVLGSGGTLVELVGDVVTLLLPTSPDNIARAVQTLRVGRLLDGFRGRPKADIQNIASEIHRLCVFYLKDYPNVSEIEINPLFVYANKVCAVDALIHKSV